MTEEEKQKRWESQTELERDLRYQLAEMTAERAEWLNRYNSVSITNDTLHARIGLLESQIDGLKNLNDTQNKLLERYQQHITLALESNKQNLLSLGDGKHD